MTVVATAVVIVVITAVGVACMQFWIYIFENSKLSLFFSFSARLSTSSQHQITVSMCSRERRLREICCQFKMWNVFRGQCTHHTTHVRVLRKKKHTKYSRHTSQRSLITQMMCKRKKKITKNFGNIMNRPWKDSNWHIMERTRFASYVFFCSTASVCGCVVFSKKKIQITSPWKKTIKPLKVEYAKCTTDVRSKFVIGK